MVGTVVGMVMGSGRWTELVRPVSVVFELAAVLSSLWGFCQCGCLCNLG